MYYFKRIAHQKATNEKKSCKFAIMERVNLTKDEKRVLRLVAHGGDYSPALCPECTYIGCVRSLKRKGLVKGAYFEGGGVEATRLTDEGRMLLADNPKLTNPIDWRWVITTIIAVIGALAAIAALFVACSKQ
jgi:hypothetical protein